MQPVKVVLNRSTPRLVGAQCSRDACCLLCPSTRQQVTVELPHAPLLASDLVQPVRLLAGQQTHGEAASCVLGGHSCLDGRRRRRRRGGAAPRRSDCLPHCWAGVALPALEEACGIRERQRCSATLAGRQRGWGHALAHRCDNRHATTCNEQRAARPHIHALASPCLATPHAAARCGACKRRIPHRPACNVCFQHARFRCGGPTEHRAVVGAGQGKTTCKRPQGGSAHSGLHLPSA